MRRRHTATPRLESLEDRVVLSTVSIHLSPSASAQIHKLGINLKNAASSVQQELAHLIQNRTGQPSHTQWQTRHTSLATHQQDPVRYSVVEDLRRAAVRYSHSWRQLALTRKAPSGSLGFFHFHPLTESGSAGSSPGSSAGGS